MIPKEYADNFLTYMSALYLFIEAYSKGVIYEKEYNAIEESLADECGIPKMSVYRFKAKDLIRYLKT